MPQLLPNCRFCGRPKLMHQTLPELAYEQDHKIRFAQFEEPIEPKCIPILLNGGVGDVIMDTAVAQVISRGHHVDIYSPHEETFNYFKPEFMAPAKGRKMPHYTWFIEMNTIGRFNATPGFMGFKNAWAEKLYEDQRTLFKRLPQLRSMVVSHPHFDNALARFARDIGLNRRDFPFFSLGLNKIDPTKKARKDPKNYITIHDGYEQASAWVVSGRATKTWKWEYWNETVRQLKKNLPYHKIIQLGTSTARPIDGVDECLVNETTITEAFDIISESSLHIDGDSGLTHAATALSVPCVVMFGPTPDYFYGYKENINIRSSFCQEACYWLKPDWLGKCPIGLKGPQCMDEITPNQVVNAAMSILEKQ